MFWWLWHIHVGECSHHYPLQHAQKHIVHRYKLRASYTQVQSVNGGRCRSWPEYKRTWENYTICSNQRISSLILKWLLFIFFNAQVIFPEGFSCVATCVFPLFVGKQLLLWSFVCTGEHELDTSHLESVETRNPYEGVSQ